MRILILWIGLTIAWIFNAWITPRTWTTGELITAAIMNAHIRDNLNALFSPVANIASITTDITETSTSFVDATGLTITFTTVGDTVVIGFVGTVSNSGSGATRTTFTLDVDGVDEGGSEGLIQVNQKGAADGESNVSFTWRITGLSIASHTFKIEWKVSAGTATLHATNSEVILWGAEIT